MVASFTDKKDYYTYLRAANVVLRQQKNVTFLCVGAGDYSKFEDMIQEGFEDRIIFIGQQTNIESIMNICDIGVLTSHGEGISNALLEFMALGKPVIATNNGGTPELVDDSINGYLINHFDVESLSYRLIDLLNDNTKRKKMGVAANQKVRDVFSIDKMIFQFMNEYEKLTK
jgi:glycosyltransferase involved in cell wall biosynthesis